MHLNAETALDLIEGRLAEDQAALWKRHIETCGRCEADFITWHGFSIDLLMIHLNSAPAVEVARAVRIFRPQPAADGAPSLIASVVFDSLLQPAAAGVRGAALLEDARQLVVRVEEYDIHLRIWRDQDRRQMLGQLLSRAGDGPMDPAWLHILQNGATIRSTMADRMGEFFFADIPEGAITLQLETPDVTAICAIDFQVEK